MKHQNQRNWFRGIKRMLLTLLCLGAFAQVQAQDVLSSLVWRDEAPKQYPDPLVSLGDDGYLYINARLSTKDIKNPKLEITLPYGVDFAYTRKDSIFGIKDSIQGRRAYQCFSGTDASNPTSNVVINNAGDPDNGKTVKKLTLSYTLNANTLRIGDSLQFKIRIKALCDVDIFNPGKFKIYISGDGFVMGGSREIQLNVQKPSLRVYGAGGADIIQFNNVGEVKTVALNVDAQNGSVNRFYMTLTPATAGVLTLKNFKLNNGSTTTALPVIYSTSTSLTQQPTGGANFAGVFVQQISATDSTVRRVVIVLTDVQLQRKVDGTPVNISFDAKSSRGCNQIINTTIRTFAKGNDPNANPNAAFTTGYCQQWTGNQIVLQLPSDGVAPQFTTFTGEMRWIEDLDTPDPNRNNGRYFCWDGVTPNYVKTTFTNTNSVPTASFKINPYIANWSNLTLCGYIDTAQVYWRAILPNGAADGSDSIVVPLSKIPSNYLGVNTSYRYTDANRFAPELLGKGRLINISLPIDADRQLPPGIKIDIRYVILANPKWDLMTYRNKTTNQFYSANYNEIYCRVWDDITAGNACGQTWVRDDNTVLAPFSSTNPWPRFKAQTQEFTVYPQQSATISNGFYSGAYNAATDAISGERYSQVYVKMPSWCNLDTVTGGGIASAFDVAGYAPTAGSGVYHGLQSGYKIYSVKYHAGRDGLLNIKVKPSACLSGGIVTDTIQFWVDQVTGTPENDCRPRFEKTSKIYSLLKLNCITPALIVDDFGVYRQTRGLKDSNNDHFPDDGTPALDNEMQHNKFLVADTGYYYIKGHVGGTGKDLWDKLVTILKYGTGGSVVANHLYKWNYTTVANTSNNGVTVPFWSNATIDIKRWTSDSTFTINSFPLSVPTVTNLDSLTVYYDGVMNDYLPNGNDSVYIKIPFYCYAGNLNTLGAYTTRTYGIKEEAPTELQGRYDPSLLKAITLCALPSMYQQDGVPNFGFAAVCQQVTVNSIYMETYWEARDFSKEVRYTNKPKMATLRVPAGYYRTNKNVYVSLWKWNNARTSDIAVVPVSATEDFASHDSIFVIDLTQLYDYDYDGSDPSITYNASIGQLSNGKYPVGDGNQGVYFTFYLKSTAAINGINNYVNLKLEYTDWTGVNRVSTDNAVTLSYSGPILFLESSPTIVYVNSQQLSLSSVKIQNSHGSITNNNVWLNLKGNVENAYLENTITHAIISGQGLNNCWLPVGTLTPLQMQNYRLVFDYKGKDACGVNDTIKLSSVADFTNTGFNPNINKPIDSVDACNRATYTYTILDSETPRARIAGNVHYDIPNPVKPGYLHHESAYTVTYTIDGKVSQGALNDPSVTITVPAGQVYVDTTAFGAAQFEYPQGTWNAIPAAVLSQLDALIGTGSIETQSRTITISAKDLLEQPLFMMPGWGADPNFGFTDSMRILNIRLPFIPTCETDLAGLRFRGRVNGLKSCGAPVEDDGMVLSTPTVYTDVLPEYSFQVQLKNVDMGKRVYSPDRIRDTLIATFAKDMGLGTDEIKAGDYVLLRLPQAFKIDGAVKMQSSAWNGDVVVSYSPANGAVNADGDRIYTLSFNEARDTLNNRLLSGTDGIGFTYRIPFIYDPLLADPTAPREEVVCQVMTNVNFKEGVCAPRPASVGAGRVLLIQLPSPEGGSFHACLNTPITLSINASGITPVWYADTCATCPELGHNSTYTFTPTERKNYKFWVRCVYAYGSTVPGEEEDFGVVPMVVYMDPIAKFAITAKDPVNTVSTNNLCADDEINLDANGSRLVAISGALQTIDLYQDSINWYLDGATTPFATQTLTPKVVLNAGTHNVKVQIYSRYNCVRDTTVQVSILARPKPKISLVDSLYTGCFKTCVEYKTEGSKTNYTWTVTNGTLQQPTEDSIVTVCWDLVSGTGNNGLVTVNYKDDKGCPAFADSIGRYNQVIRNLPPTPMISGADTTCVNGTVSYSYVPAIDASTGSPFAINTYIWTLDGGTIVSGDSTATIQVNWLDLGDHTITLEIATRYGCEPDTVGVFNVFVKGPSRPVILGSASYCEFTKDVVYTTVSGMQNYQWSVIGGTAHSTGFNPQTNSVTVDWGAAGTGYVAVRYSDNGGCTTFTTDSTVVTLKPLPVPTLINASTVACTGETVVYETESGKQNYVWTVSGHASRTGGTASDNTITVVWGSGSQGSVSVTYSDNGCSADAPAEIYVNLTKIEVKPTTGKTSLCIGGTTSLNNPTVGTKTWRSDDESIATVTNGVVSGVSEGSTYIWCRVGNASGCADSVYTEVTVNPTPTPSIIGAKTTVCAGEVVTYTTQSGKDNYEWTVSGASTYSYNATGSQVTVTWGAGATGTVSVNYSVNGCAGTASTPENITITPSVTPSFTAAKTDACVGEEVTYTVTPTPTSPDTYGWTITGGNKIAETANTVTVRWNTAGNGEVKAAYSANTNCVSVTPISVSVNVSALPDLTILNPSVCYNSTVTLAQLASSNAQIKFYNNAAKATELTSADFQNLTANKTYYAQATNISGCVSEVKQGEVTVQPEVGLTLSKTADNICAGTVYDLTTIPTGIGANEIEYWHGGVKLSTPNAVSSAGVYTMKAVNGSCTSASKDFTLTVIATPVAPTVANPSVTYCQNATPSALTATGSNLKWYDENDNLLGATAPTVSTATVGTTIYKVSQSTAAVNGCESPKTIITIKVNVLPTFTVKSVAPICNGANVDLADAVSNVSEGSTVKYYSNATATTELASSIVTPAATTTYYAQAVNNTTGCKSNIQSITVTVNALPAAPTTTDIALCQNAAASPLTATATTGNSLKWYDASGTALTSAPTPNTSVAGTTTYKVSQVTPAGCESPTANLVVTVTATPVAPTVANPSVTYCQNETPSALTATGSNLKWYDENDNLLGTTAPTVSTATVGTTVYKVSQSTAAVNGCESPKTIITIKVNVLPTFTVKSVAPICNGANVDLADAVSNVSEGATVKYYSNATATTELASSIVTPAATTTYYAQAVNNTTGCKSNIQSITVTVNALPAAPTASPVTLCQNAAASPLTATATTGNSLKWYDASGTALASAPTPNTSVAGTTTYKVSQVSAAGCESEKADLVVTVTATPVAPTVANPTITYCQNETPSALTATGSNLNWYDENDNLLGATAPTVSTATVGTTVYKVSQSTASGCESPKTIITIKVNVLPTFTVKSVAPICNGANVDLSDAVSNVSEGATVKYYSNNTATAELASSIVTPAATTTYYAQAVNNTTGCKSNIQSITVTVNALPAAPTASPVTLCQNAAASPLTATAATGNSLKWYDASGTALASAPTPNTSVAGATTYKVSQVTPAGCESPTVNLLVTVTATPTTPTVANPTITYCQNETPSALSATGSNLKWYDENDNLLGTTAPTVSTAVVGTTIYKVSQSTAAVNGCESPKTIITIKVNVLPTFTVKSVAPICNGANIDLADAVSNVSEGATVKYYSNATATTELASSIVTPAATTTYYAQAVNNTTGCKSNIQSITVTVNALPAAPTASPVTLCQNAAASPLTATAAIGNSLKWYDASGTALTSAPTPNTSVAGTTTYKVSQVSAAGCESEKADLVVTVTATPVAPTVANPTVTYCQNETPSALSATGSNLKWYDENDNLLGTTAPAVSTAVVGTTIYKVSQSTAAVNGCESPKTIITIKVNVLPTFTVKSVAPICNGSNVDLADAVSNVSEGATVKYYSNATATTELASSIVTPAATTTYYAQAVNNTTGCKSNIQSITVTVNALPAAPTTSPVTLCQNAAASPLTATAAAGNSLKWYDASGTALTSAPTPNTSVAGTTTYKVSQLSAAGCESEKADLVVTVTTVPSVHLHGSDICISESGVVFIAHDDDDNALSGGIWHSNDTRIAAIIVDTIGEVTGVSAGTFSVVYHHRTSDGCLTESESLDYQVFPLPTVTVSDKLICAGSEVAVSSLVSTILNGDRFDVYDVATGGSPLGVTLAPTVTTTYYVEATNTNSHCVSAERVPVIITVIDEPTFTLDATEVPVCNGGSVDLATIISNVNIPNYEVEVYKADAVTPVTGTVVVPSGSSEVFNVRIVSTEAGCVSAFQTVRVNAGAVQYVSLSGGKYELCTGESLSLTATPTGANANNQVWSSDDISIVDVNNAGVITAVNAGQTIIRYTYRDNDGCQGVGSRLIKVAATPVLSVTADQNICEGAELLLRNLVTAHTGDTLIYSAGGSVITSTYIVITQDTTISIISRNRVSGCESLLESVRIRKLSSPNPAFDLFTSAGDTQTSICAGSDLTLSPLKAGGEWTVTPAALATISGNKLTAIGSLNDAKTITVTYSLTNSQGCTSDSVKTLTINPLPKAVDAGFSIILLPDGTPVNSGGTASVCADDLVNVLTSYTRSSRWELVYSDTEIETLTNEANAVHINQINKSKRFDVISLTDKLTGCVNNNATDLSALGITITVKSPVRILESPVGGGICLPDGTLDLTVTVSNDASDKLSYVWTKVGNASDTLGTDATYTATSAGSYQVKVEGCNADSATATVTEELPLIVQIRNHTLLVNNNPATNGNYEFAYYKWYKDGELLWENSGWENKGGYYYTGGKNLDVDAQYWTIVKDINGVEHRSCPFTVTLQRVAANVQAYPNPTGRTSTVVTVDAEVNDEAALAGATITIYSPSGQYLGSVAATGRYTQVSLPSVSGVYILVFKSEEISKEIKIIVE